MVVPRLAGGADEVGRALRYRGAQIRRLTHDHDAGVGKAAPASEGEQALLAASGAAKADPNVRQELRAEVREAAKRKSYADGVLFWRGDKVETGSPLIASEEAERVQTVRQTAPRPAAQPAPVIEKAPEPAPAAEAAADAKEAEQKTEAEDEGGGWFDWF